MRLFLKRGAALLGRRIRRPPSGIRVLGYHRIGGTSRLEIDISIAAFLEQLRELRSRGPVMSLAAAIESSRQPKRLSGSVLTFDDGFADTFTHCVGILRAQRTPAHFYLSTADVQRGWIPTAAGNAEAVRPDVVTELSRDPLFTFGSHSHSHRVFLHLSDEEIHRELLTSRSLIQEWTSAPVPDFAYPKGLWHRRAERIVRTYFRSAVMGGSHPLTDRTDLHRISRYPIQASDDLGIFRAKLDGALFLEDAARSARDRLRLVTGRVPER